VGQDLAAIRHQLLSLIKHKSKRKTEFKVERPIDWRPTEVIDPRSGSPFTPSGAWDFIEEKLRENHAIEEVELEKPPGRKAYVLLVPTQGKEIYIKVQLGSGVIWGRSFHYSKVSR